MTEAEITEKNYRRALARARVTAEFRKTEQPAEQELIALLIKRLGKDIGRAITLLGKASPYFNLGQALKGAHKQMRE